MNLSTKYSFAVTGNLVNKRNKRMYPEKKESVLLGPIHDRMQTPALSTKYPNYSIVKLPFAKSSDTNEAKYSGTVKSFLLSSYP